MSGIRSANMYARLLFLLLGLGSSVAGPAQFATLDPSFSADGFDTLSTNAWIGYDNMTGFTEVALQADGRILSAGYIGLSEYAYVTRHLANGEPDTAFADQGTFLLPFWTAMSFAFEDLVVQPDGRILVAGSSSVFNGLGIIRLTPGGALDTSFAGLGYTIVYGTGGYLEGADLSVRSDGHIALVSHVYDANTDGIFAAVLTPSGTLDAAFDGDGRLTYFIPGEQLIVRQAGLDSLDRIVVAGDHPLFGMFPGEMFVTRIATDGSIDPGFGSGGFVYMSPSPYQGLANGALHVHADGRIVIAGVGLMVRLLDDGSADGTFGSSGTAYIPSHPMGVDLPRGLTCDASGRYIISGVLFDSTPDVWQHVIVRRVEADGTLDTSFGPSASFVWPPVYDGTSGDAVGFHDLVQPDGRIVLCGGARPPGSPNTNALVMRLYFSGETGIPEGLGNMTCSVAPDPARSEAVVRYVLAGPAMLSMRIIDPAGRTVRAVFANERHAAGTFSRPLDLAGLVAGTYVLLLNSPSGSTATRIVKE